MAEGRVARVIGPPVLWKDCRNLLGKRKVINAIVGVAVVGLLAWTYTMAYRDGNLGAAGVQAMYLLVFFSVGMLATTVLPATCITMEKEAQTWPLLLTTSIDAWEILAGKFGGVVRRCLPAWVLLFGHAAGFAIAGYIHPMAILQLGLIVLWTTVFLSCTGLYFSLRFKHTTTAVIANLGTAAGLWAIVPLMMAIVMVVGRIDSDVIEPYLDMNPFVQASVVAMATTQAAPHLDYRWVQGGLSSAADATGWILLTALIHGIIGLAISAWTGFRMRRNPL